MDFSVLLVPPSLSATKGTLDASAVRSPKYVIKKGKTPVLTPEEARLLLDSIDVTELSGLGYQAD